MRGNAWRCNVLTSSDMLRRLLVVLSIAVPGLYAQAAAELTLEQKEEFLRKAKIVTIHGAKKGVTGTSRATLSDGVLTHDASIQKIDEEKARFETDRGTEMGFRDTYKFNIAGYRLARLLGLADRVPPSIERNFEGNKAAWTWWVEDVQMDEAERLKRKAEDPNHQRWTRQYQIMKVFDQLIFNTDRNQTNILYDKNWKLWMIDHTRAFRTRHDLLNPKSLETCDVLLLEKMKALNEGTLRTEIGAFVRPAEIKGLLARRDLIVAHFEKAGPEKLFEFLPRN